MNLRHKFAVVWVGGVCLLIAFLYGKIDKKGPKGIAVLPKNDTEQISFNPATHQLIILGPGNKKTVETLPDRTSKIDVHKDGSVSVTSPQFGFEERPFIGVMVSDQFRFVAGSDLVYYKRLDLGVGVGVNRFGGSFTGIAKVSYNIWSNISVGMSYDTAQHIGVGLTVRL